MLKQCLITIALLAISLPAIGDQVQSPQKHGKKAAAAADRAALPAEKKAGAHRTAALLEQSVDDFRVPEYIQHDVDFWAKVYREWDINQVVIYDSPSKAVYRVLNLPRLEFALSASKYRNDVQAEVSRIQAILARIAAGEHKTAASDERFAQIYDVLSKNDLLGEKELKDRMRQQSGLRSQFEFGLKASGRYADDMRAVLRSQNLPEDLLAMVFVESLFLLSAQSHAGATGPWGIMKETAINAGIYVNKFTDERVDPVVATLGAARYLKKAKENLSEWPLVITAYNYGYPGMLRAVSNLGSKDFSVIIAKHESPIFKYASKNYYAEFLAALDTVRNHETYFPGLQKEEHWEYELVQVQRPVSLEDLASVGAVSREDVVKLNPSLTKFTITGAEVIPSDYALRVPKGASNRFYTQIKRIPSGKRAAAGLKVSSKYQARGKESLNAIAKRLGLKADIFSERVGKPGDHRPVGPLLIRSQLYGYSPLLEINKSMLTALATGQALERPPEIGTVEKNP